MSRFFSVRGFWALAIVLSGLAVSVSAARAETTAPAAQASAEVTALISQLQLDQTFAVIAEEGLSYGKDIEDQMFPGQGGTHWTEMVAAIYRAGDLRARFEAAFAENLADDAAAIAAAREFFGSARGQAILTMEIAARRALLDTAAEEAAEVEAERMQVDRDPRMGLIRDLIEAGDMIEMNVSGALTANLAFFQGMNDVGIPGMVMDDEQMLTEVWGQEASIRSETTKWLFSYMALAYRDLSDDDLRAYIAFTETPEGQRINAALFASFDQVFRRVSFDLGRAAALVMQGTEI